MSEWFMLAQELWIMAGVLVIIVVAGFIVSRLVRQRLMLANLIRERGRWRQAFRDEVAQFCALASQHYYSVQNKDQAQTELLFCEHVKALNELRVKVRLRLNPNELIDSYDTKLIRAMRRVVLQFETRQYDNLNRELVRIERCAQRLLKTEWDRSKREARLGRFEGH